jgi:hypothetical protein
MEGEYKYVRLDEKEDAKNVEMFEKVYADYVDKFGIDNKFKQQIELIKKIAILQCEYLISKNRFKLTQIEVENTKLEAIKKETGVGMTLQQTLIHLSKWLGYRLDWKQVSVSEYYTILNESSKQAKNG